MIGPVALATDVIAGIKGIVSMGDAVRLNKCGAQLLRLPYILLKLFFCVLALRHMNINFIEHVYAQGVC